MSQDNVDVVSAAFRAFAEGDMEGVLSLCDEDIRIVQPADLPGVAGSQRGHAGVLEAFAIWPQQWHGFRVEILRLTDVGDHVVVTTRQSGRGRESGALVETRFTFLFSIRAGKIAEWRMFMREGEALEAIGLGR